MAGPSSHSDPVSPDDGDKTENEQAKSWDDTQLPAGFVAPNKEKSFSVSDDDNLPREANILVPDYDQFLEGHGQRPGHLATEPQETQEPTAEPQEEPPAFDEEGWAPMEWEAGLWGAEHVEEGDGDEADKEETGGIGSDIKNHRFGLRLGRHQSGNLISKLRARLKKDDPDAEDEPTLREAEETEAAEERIEPDERYKEIETYPIRPPYGHIRILFDEETKEYIYQTLEPVLTKTERDILAFIEESLVDSLTVSPHELENMDDRAFITERFNDVIFDYSIILHEEEEKEEEIKRKLLYYVLRNFIGHGRIDLVMEDPYIEDISCDGPKIPIFLYHRKYESVRSTVVYPSHDELDSYVIKMAQRSSKHISIAEPILDATLPDGSRLQSTLGKEVSAGGSTFTIRKFRPDPFTPPDLVLFRTMSAEMLAYLWIAVQHSSSVLYSGGTASGKTTSLNAILLFIPPQMKIVTIEDTREVNLPHENWIAGITRHGFGPRDQFGRQAGEIDMFQLLKNALRQRPEYIIVGEVRGHEAYSLFQAMATGHAAYGTMHADSVDAVIHRLESDPINVPRNLLEALDVVSVQIQTRVGGKRVRRTKQISEIVGIDPHTKEILTNEVFRWVPKDDSFKFSGISYILERIQLEKALPDGSMVRELTRRAAIIEWMIKKRIQDYREVSRIVSAYYREPELVLGLVEGRLSEEEIPTGLREIALRTEEGDDDNPLSAAALEASKVSSDPDAQPGTAAAQAAQEPQDEPTPGAASDPPHGPDEQEHDVQVPPATSAARAHEPQPQPATARSDAGSLDAQDQESGHGRRRPGATDNRRDQPDPADLLRRPRAEGSADQGGWGSPANPSPENEDAVGRRTEQGDATVHADDEEPETPPGPSWGVAPGLLDAAARHKEAEERIERISADSPPGGATTPVADNPEHETARGDTNVQATAPSGIRKQGSEPDRRILDPEPGDASPAKASPPEASPPEPSPPEASPSEASPPEAPSEKASRRPEAPHPSASDLADEKISQRGHSAPPAREDETRKDAPKKADHRRGAAPVKNRFKHRLKRDIKQHLREGKAGLDEKTQNLHHAVDEHLAERARNQRPGPDWTPQKADAWLSGKEEKARGEHEAMRRRKSRRDEEKARAEEDGESVQRSEGKEDKR